MPDVNMCILIFSPNINSFNQPIVQCPSRDWEFVGSIPGRVIIKTLKMGPTASMLDSQHEGLDLGG